MLNSFGGYDSHEYIAEIYDFVYADRSLRDINFFVDYSQNAAGRTLELGCGTGRVLIPAAVSGSIITGLDISYRMLAKCRQKLEEQPASVRDHVNLVQGNMTGFSTGESYSLVTLPFRSFHHLITVQEQKACLEQTYRHLVPQGRLVLDILNTYPPSMFDPKYWAEQEYRRDLELSGSRKLRCAARIVDFHRDRQYNDQELIYEITFPDGKVERLVQSYPFRYFFRYEVEHLLELCGFRLIELFGDYDKSAYFNDSPEMIFIAERND